MTKKSLSKLLSVILTLAICFATVFGCLITANATDVECYTWSDGDVAEELDSATINLNLIAPTDYLSDGIYEATFSVASEDDALVLESVELTGGTRVDGTAFSVDDYSVNYIAEVATVDVYAASYEDNASSLVLTLTFSFADGVATKGNKYYATINNLEMTDGTDGTDGDGHYIVYTGTATAGLMDAGCDHIFDITGLEAIEINTVDGYYVYQNVPCANGCGTINEYQVVPATTLENIVYWDGTVSETLEGTGTEADPFIIATPADLALITSKTVTGGYYKVADGVDVFVLQPEAHAAVMDLVDFEQTRAYFANNKDTVTAWANGGTFQGYFDGNGVEIYGMYSTNTNGGLFSTVKVGENNSSIKNVTVKNSYVMGASASSALVASAVAGYSYTVAESTATGYIQFEKVVLANNYVFNTYRNNYGNRMGLMLANAATYVNVKMDSCLVYGNHIEGYYKNDDAGAIDTTATVEGGLFGVLSKGHNGESYGYQNGMYSNSIILDVVPYAANQDITGTVANHAFRPQFFTNVYTNCTSEHTPSTSAWFTWSQYEGKIITLDKTDFKGAHAADIVETLNTAVGSELWVVDENGGYPMFTKDVITVGGGEILYARGEPQDAYMAALVATKAGTAESNPYGMGTEDDPFIIESQHHLRTLVQRFDASLAGSYFKVADGIDAFVLQNDSTTFSVDALKAMSTSELKTKLAEGNVQWQNGTDTATYSYFSGHIDFNGITIYGMFNKGGGLFGGVKGNVSFKNLTIANSYITGAGHVGAILSNYPQDNSSLTGAGTVKFENCAVVNCYIESTTTSIYYGAGALAGHIANGFQDTNDVDTNGNTSEWHNGTTTISNCLVYGTEITSNTGAKGGLVCSSGSNGIRFNNCLVLGAKPYTTWTSWQGNLQHCIKPDYFTNVYTDQSITDASINGTSQTYKETQISSISASSVEGIAAIDTLAGFDFDTVWSYDGNGGYPTPVAQGEILAKTQFNLNLLAVNNSYNDDGTFNFNFYYAPTGDIKPVLYVGRADGNGFDKLVGTEIGEAEATQLGVEVGTLKYTIESISSREIGDNFLATAVAKIGSSIAYGKTESISPATYATAILQDQNQSIEDRQVAAALIGYGSDAKAALESKLPANATKNVVYVTTSNINQTAPTKGSGTESDPYIIENAHHIRYLAQKSTPDTTYGVYYKVDPDIDVLVFQTESYINTVAGSLDAFLALDAEGTKTALSNTSGRIQYQSGSSGSTASEYDGFAGNIDFSGVTICGMYNANGGLFTYVNGGASFKNLTLCNNYITSTWFNGNLVGYVLHGSAATSVTDDNGTTDDTTDDTTTNIYRPLTISNVVVHDCYQYTTKSGYSQTGVLMGVSLNSKHIPIYTSYILTYDNISLGTVSSSDTTEKECALFGSLPSGWNGSSDGVQNAIFNNIVTLDCVPYPTATINNQCTRAANYSCVYTTDVTEATPNTFDKTWSDFDITVLSSADLAIGGAAKTNMPKLDWTNVWCVNKNAYPTLITSGVEVEVPGSVIYWDGSNYDSTIADNGETGTDWDNAIIIDSAEELYYITNKADISATAGKYFKVADGIDTIVLQPEGVLNLNTLLSCKDSSEVADYLTGLSGLSNWNTNAETWFSGSFDGNGVTIMGMYSNARSAGLFPTVDGGTPDANSEDNTGITIGNFTLKNSYVLANSGQNRAGAIVGGTSSVGYGNKVNGTITFNKCVVANCYVQSAGGYSAAGIMLGANSNEIVHIKNCLVYGSKAYYTSDGSLVEDALYNGWNSRLARDEAGNQIAGSYVDNTVSNSIILGVRPYALTWNNRISNARCLTNVYTDQSTSPYTADTYTEENLKAVTADALIGSGATDVVNALNTVADETIWYVGNNVDGMPGITKSSSIPTAFAADYANVKFESYNDYGTSTDNFGLYASSLTLTNNPYMSLSFAFGVEDGINFKQNRDKITIEIKYDSNGDGATDTTITTTPPAYDGNFISDVDGWTNKKGAGRYHSYKLELPVYALASDIEVLITYDDGTTTKTISNTISVSGFGNELDTAYKTLPCDYYSTRIDAVKSLLFYIQALQTKFK